MAGIFSDRQLSRTQSVKLSAGVRSLSIPEPSPAAPRATSGQHISRKRSPLIRTRFSQTMDVRAAAIDATRPEPEPMGEQPSRASSDERKAALTPNSRRVVSRLQRKTPPSSRGASKSQNPLLSPLDLRSLSKESPTCYSPLVRADASPIFSPRRIQCVGNYDLGKTIGRGRFGKVKLATHVLTGQQVAVKIISKAKLSVETGALIRREVDILKKLHHPNIIKLYEVIETERVLFLIMEHASGGEVLDFIVSHQKLSEPRAMVLFRQIVSAIGHCHGKGIVHRDLKAENLLLDENLEVKVIDFGLSNFFTPAQLLKTPCGSPTYAAPELLEKKDYDGTAVDVWSLGVNLFVFVSGSLPFKGNDLVTLYSRILGGEYEMPDYLSDDCKDLISRMLVVDPLRRMRLAEVIHHPWLQNEDIPMPKQASDEDLMDSDILEAMLRAGFKEDEARQAGNSFNPVSATKHILLDRKRKRESMMALRSVQRTKSENTKDFRMSTQAPNVSMPTIRRTPLVRKRSRQSGSGTSGPQHKRASSVQDESEEEQNVVRRSREEEDLSTQLELLKIDSTSMSPPPISPPGVMKARAEAMRSHRRAQSVDFKSDQFRSIVRPNPATRPIYKQAVPDGMSSLVEVTRSTTSSPRGRLSCSSARTSPVKDFDEERSDPRYLNKGQTARLSSPKTLTEEELAEWSKTEEHEREQIQRASKERKEEFPSKNFLSFVAWTKHVLNKKAAEAQRNEPRTARVPFQSKMTSSKQPDVIMDILEAKLRLLDLSFMKLSNFCIKVVCEGANVQCELEVCRMPGLSDMYSIRMKRVGGDWTAYRDICDRVSQACAPSL